MSIDPPKTILRVISASGNVRVAAWALVAVFLCLPTATAGSPEQPELRDAHGDQDPPAPATNYADLWAAWIHDEDQDAFKVTLQSASQGEIAEGVYRVWWEQRYPLAPFSYGGVHAVVSRTNPTEWSTLRGSLPPGQPAREPTWTSNATTGVETFGSPGTLTWVVPKVHLGIHRGYNLSNFRGDFVESPTLAFDIQDQARGGGSFIVGPAVDFASTKFAPPSRTEDFQDEEDSNNEPSADLRKVWIDFEPTTINFTLQLSSLSLSSWANCPGSPAFEGGFWDLEVSMFSSSRNRGFSQFEADATVWSTPEHLFKTRAYAIDLRASRIANLSVLDGDPGYVRLSADRTLWGGSEDLAELNGLDVTVEYRCAPDGAYSLDILSTYQSHGFIPVPAWVLGIALLAALMLSRRRGAR